MSKRWVNQPFTIIPTPSLKKYLLCHWSKKAHSRDSQRASGALDR
jgi:hypothetical protein